MHRKLKESSLLIILYGLVREEVHGVTPWATALVDTNPSDATGTEWLKWTRLLFFPSLCVISSAYLKLFTVLPAIRVLPPRGDSSNPAIHIILSVYKLNRYRDSRHLCRTSFFTWKLAVSPCSVLITASWFSYRFLSSTKRCVGIEEIGGMRRCLGGVNWTPLYSDRHCEQETHIKRIWRLV